MLLSLSFALARTAGVDKLANACRGKIRHFRARPERSGKFSGKQQAGKENAPRYRERRYRSPGKALFAESPRLRIEVAVVLPIFVADVHEISFKDFNLSPLFYLTSASSGNLRCASDT